LGEFNLEIRHIPGRSNRMADALSRKHYPGSKKEHEEQILRDEWWGTKCPDCRKLEEQAAKVTAGVRAKNAAATSWDCIQALLGARLTL